MPEADNKKGRLSRRDFLKGMGSGALGAATLTTGGLLSKETAAALLGPEAERISGGTTIQLKINGKLQRVSVEPRSTLLGVLREKLELTGSKEVCDRGQCGACTVLLDGKATLACMTLALDARGAEVTTVEGLAKGDGLSPLQQAFVEYDGLMCGFCTPGLVMASSALLAQNPDPSLDDIKAGLSGNICRCGTYPKVFAAVQAAARKMRKGG